MGKVYLIGGGPGDETLITLKAVEVLEKCTAVLYDRLAGEKYLKYLNDSCVVHYCGKEPGAHSKTQEEINELLLTLANQGHIIGRIKGGDPYVFGRGGEEGLMLHEEGIPFEVIPGVTSAIAVLSYAGIPVTHRGIAQSFHVFTGTSVNKLNINWESVGKLEGTLVFLMGLGNLDHIIEKLVENGKDPETPCAVIMKGTTSDQDKAIGNLKNISKKVEEKQFTSPCIIVVGEVVTLNESLGWYEKQPLYGRNICITRTKEQAGPLRKELLSLGAEVTQIHTIDIKPETHELDPYREKLGDYEFIVFTSVNGVKLFFQYLMEKNIDIRKIKGEFAAIGPATLREIEQYGIIPTILAKEFFAESLCDALEVHVKQENQILLPTSLAARDTLTQRLEKCGAHVDRVNIYRPQVGISYEDFSKADVVLFTSPSTVKNMIEIEGLDAIKEKVVLAIGPVTKRELVSHGIISHMCEACTVDAMVEKLLELAEKKII